MTLLGWRRPCIAGSVPAIIARMHRQLRGNMKFDDVKSDTLNLRVSPTFKLALKAAASHEQRSMVNMLEVLVANYCDTHRIAVSGQPPQAAKVVSKQRSRAAT